MERRSFLRGAGLMAAAAATGIGSTVKKAYSAGINRLENLKSPSVLEKKHVPEIKAPSSAKKGETVMVTVNVGFGIEHPATEGHWIREIKLLSDGLTLAIATFPEGENSASKAVFPVRLDSTTTLEALADCNLHGVWIGDSKTIKVS